MHPWNQTYNLTYWILENSGTSAAGILLPESEENFIPNLFHLGKKIPNSLDSNQLLSIDSNTIRYMENWITDRQGTIELLKRQHHYSLDDKTYIIRGHILGICGRYNVHISRVNLFSSFSQKDNYRLCPPNTFTFQAYWNRVCKDAPEIDRWTAYLANFYHQTN